jgi:hypothetical protein
MQRVILLAFPVVLVLGLDVPAGAASKARQCRAACSGLITACANVTNDFGFGDLNRGCTRAVLKRCKRDGPQVCANFCGDGNIASGEVCDGTNLGEMSCRSLGFASGTLACAVGCTLDTSGCNPFPAPPPTCGNGARDGSEQCDGTDLGGATCASLGFTPDGTLACTAGCGFDTSGCGCRSQAFPATGQMTCHDSSGTLIPCAGSGHDGEIQAGATLAYVDNGDGTITDVNTGLTWEKKSDDGSIHDKDTKYTWADAFAVHVAGLNTANFAGTTTAGAEREGAAEHRGLRENRPGGIAGIQHELLRGCSVTTCSCTVSNYYWASTTYALAPSYAWRVFFTDALASAGFKPDDFYVRAVRAARDRGGS